LEHVPWGVMSLTSSKNAANGEFLGEIMENEMPQIPHDSAEHQDLQVIVQAVHHWFDTPNGQAFRQVTQDKQFPKLMFHLLKDTASGDPDQLPQSITTSFMTGAMVMRDWMIERQSEPIPEEVANYLQLLQTKQNKEEENNGS